MSKIGRIILVHAFKQVATMYSSTLLSSLLLAGTSLASLSTVTVTSFVTESAAPSSIHTAASASPHHIRNGTATKTFEIYDLYGLKGTVTPDVSIIAAGPAATTFRLACPMEFFSGSQPSCGDLDGPLTVTEGPKILEFATTSRSHNTTKTFSVSCEIEPTTAATCVAQEGDLAHPSSISRDTYTMSGTDMFSMVPVTVTRGAHKIANGTHPYATGSTGIVRSTGGFSSTGRVGPRPTSSGSPTGPAPSATSRAAAVANAPVMAGVGALAGLAMAAVAL
ncbi:MAG: hypothetical protein INR71_13290 [Terriglobus roseus]|nr:hypothetical protein [Terriglobus roseus]